MGGIEATHTRGDGALWATILMLVILACSLSSFAVKANDPPVIANVQAEQNPVTMHVLVSYNVYDPDGDPITITLRLSENGGISYPIRCLSVSGDVGAGITNGIGKHILWDALADYPGSYGDYYVVKVVARDGYLGQEMVLVPAGTFIMGDGETACSSEHEVTLTRDLYLGQHEVTNDEYLEAVQWAYDQGYVTATTSSVSDNLDGSSEELLDLNSYRSEIKFDGAGTFYLREVSSIPGDYNPDFHPVKEVTWFGAVRYCDWLSMKLGLPRAYEHSGDWTCNYGDPYGAQGYRLPTEAEWEYAAQWNDDRIYPWGDEDPDCSQANNLDIYGDPTIYCVGWTSPVGNYPDAPAALGLSDMAGNIAEWCNDWLVCGLGTNPVTDPPGPPSGTSRAVRGGGWASDDVRLLCARRGTGSSPGQSSQWEGFRVVRTANP
ncbi:MAG: SUMF1/EgtB/PvdO family nonheme iron enzyme [Candidatus Eisenbacteria bacterium]|uniref:SUMF1/EgtB/PvdO family nonheme iron enzyme n=1 Tax=Eiseniibacteriota bacterium TaxID=2212470 RepID=A0A948WAY8_UNCEI|nr:SUMF1/EgtB/PvdO family nonheme iron enzyme [Candidatus Eisenbacteria bacterium]MBU1951062.1 SUMF1/EgtB/PvdO family nonheme iron enzyme [Candidatus Eisenbacteria bacterium]MBU2689483.1 SUMF1/EgtB/PvdO family nonheme iron enzyme [Candidatus Eisenbacteria bacterium]